MRASIRTRALAVLGLVVAATGCTAIAGYDDVEPWTPTAGEGCSGPGAVLHDAHCYFTIDARSWSDARDACEAAGAHLVTIATKAEDDVVRALGGGDKWIGLSRSSVIAPFRWVDGASTGYEGWRSGEPNGSGRCARMADGGWADWDCDERYAAVCERD